MISNGLITFCLPLTSTLPPAISVTTLPWSGDMRFILAIPTLKIAKSVYLNPSLFFMVADCHTCLYIFLLLIMNFIYFPSFQFIFGLRENPLASFPFLSLFLSLVCFQITTYYLSMTNNIIGHVPASFLQGWSDFSANTLHHYRIALSLHTRRQHYLLTYLHRVLK